MKIRKEVFYSKAGLVLLAFAAIMTPGMPDGLSGVAWASIRAGFSIPPDVIDMLPVAAAGYLTSGFFNGSLILKWRASCVLILGLIINAAGLFVSRSIPLADYTTGGFHLILAASFVTAIFVWKSAKFNGSKYFMDLKTFNCVTLHQPQARMNGLMFFLTVEDEISLRAWISDLRLELSGIHLALSGIFFGSFTRIDPEFGPLNFT